MGLPPHAPLGDYVWETRIGALSSACGRCSLRFPISITLNPAQRARDSNPQDLPEELRPSDSHLRFAAA